MRKSHALAQVLLSTVVTWLGAVQLVGETSRLRSKPESAEVPGLSVAELIGLERFGTIMFGGNGGDDLVMSPDGSQIATVTQKGDLRQNIREFALRVFSTDDQGSESSAKPLVTRSSKSNQPAISQITWLANNSIAFLSRGTDGVSRIEAVDVRTAQCVSLHSTPDPLIAFKIANAGRKIIFIKNVPIKEPPAVDIIRSRGVVIPRTALISDVISGRWDSTASVSEKLYVLSEGVVRSVSLPATYGECADFLTTANDVVANYISVSPSGEHALLRCRPFAAPPAWRNYEDGELQKSLRNGDRYLWWIVLDLVSGDAHPLTGAPGTGSVYKTPKWTDDSQCVILENEWMPLSGIDSAEFAKRSKMRMSGKINVRTGTVEELTPSTKESVTSKTTEINEGTDEPWKLVTKDVVTGKTRVIYDPNRELLSRRELCRVSTVEWTSRSGARLQAGVYWPSGAAQHRKNPMVIQTHGFDGAKFEPDGYSTTAYAAQALAAEGILVVQAFRTLGKTPLWESQSEAERIREGWESLVDFLDGIGVVDRSKVALQGYSRSNFHVLYFLTHSAYPIAAAITSDGIDAGYLQYLVFGPKRSDLREVFENFNGGPAATNFGNWLARSPSFGMKNVSAPLLLYALGGAGYATPETSLLEQWEPFAGLVLQNKPVELMYLPDAAHNVVKPWERFVIQQGAVDWFRFWLQGYERSLPNVEAGESDGSLSAQYKRWRALIHPLGSN